MIQESEIKTTRADAPSPGGSSTLGVDITRLITWTVSSAKLGNGVANLLDPSPDTFWESDGFPPHLITLHFRSFTLITSIMILTGETDESYLPELIELRAGTEEEGEFAPLTLLDRVELRKGWNELTTFSRGGWGEPEDPCWGSSKDKKKMEGKGRPRTERESERMEYDVERRVRTDSECNHSPESSDNEDDAANICDQFFGCTTLQISILKNFLGGRDCRVRRMRIFTIPPYT